MSSLSIAKSQNPKSVTPKKGSAKSNATTRRKIPSTAATPKKPLRSVESKAERVAAAKTPVKIDQPQVERLTKQERVLTLLSQPEGASIEEMMQATDWQQHSVARVPGGHGEKEAWFPAHISEARRWRSPLSHRNAARSLTWTTKRRSMSHRRSRGSRSCVVVPSDEKAEEWECPNLLEVNHPGQLPRPWPAAEVVHQVAVEATHGCGPGRCLDGRACRSCSSRHIHLQ
jgi:Protein of unknown function (DUF3489)